MSTSPQTSRNFVKLPTLPPHYLGAGVFPPLHDLLCHYGEHELNDNFGLATCPDPSPTDKFVNKDAYDRELKLLTAGMGTGMNAHIARIILQTNNTDKTKRDFELSLHAGVFAPQAGNNAESVTDSEQDNHKDNDHLLLSGTARAESKDGSWISDIVVSCKVPFSREDFATAYRVPVKSLPSLPIKDNSAKASVDFTGVQLLVDGNKGAKWTHFSHGAEGETADADAMGLVGKAGAVEYVYHNLFQKFARHRHTTGENFGEWNRVYHFMQQPDGTTHTSATFEITSPGGQHTFSGTAEHASNDSLLNLYSNLHPEPSQDELTILPISSVKEEQN